jgi:regulator of replication initiation timing
MHHAKNYANKVFPLMEICRHARERLHASQPGRLACRQLAPQHEGSSSGSNDPIGNLEAQVDQLRAELRHRNDLWVADGERINDLRTEIRHLQDQLADRDLALDWAVSSRSLAWAKEARVQAHIEELSSAVDNLQVYYMKKFMCCIHNYT